MKKLLLLFLLIVTPLVFAFDGCSSSNDFKKGKRQLQNQDYTNIKNTGYSFFCCSDEDTFSTGFKATDKDGNTVTGCFCSGWLKGVTIRFN